MPETTNRSPESSPSPTQRSVTPPTSDQPTTDLSTLDSTNPIAPTQADDSQMARWPFPTGERP